MTTPFSAARTPVIVLPTVYGTWRQDVHTALMTMLADFRAAALTQGIVHATWHALPDSLTGESPFTYIGSITESVKHDMDLRTTDFNGTLGYVDWITDRQQLDDRINQFADLMRDLFTYNARCLDPGMLEQTSAADAPPELRQGMVVLGHFEIGWHFNVQEGYR